MKPDAMQAEVLARLHAACFTTPRPWTAPEIAALLADGTVFLCDAEAPASHDGFALGRALAGEAELLTLAVAPERRRKGIGRRLLAAFETEARQRGAATAFLEVAADNTAARALYQAAGYAPVGRRKGYYRGPDGDRTDALVFRREIA